MTNTDVEQPLGGKRMIGNALLRTRLARDIRDGTLSHAYLIEGAHGMGKHLLAQLLCAAIVCEHPHGGELPCGKCRSCERVLETKTADVMILGREEKASIGVDDVRFLRSDVLFPPNDLPYKFYIIEDAHTLTAAAQNALLLTVEEPPAYAVFFFLCENGANMLETIRSRAPSLRLCPVPAEQMDAYLTTTQHAYAALPQQEREELLCMSAGSVGRAIELLDGRARKPLLEKRQFVAQTVEHCLSASRRDTVRCMERLSAFGTAREDVFMRLGMMQEALRDLIALKRAESAPLCFYAQRESALLLSERSTVSALLQLFEAVEYTRNRIRRNANVRLALSELLLCENCGTTSPHGR